MRALLVAQSSRINSASPTRLKPPGIARRLDIGIATLLRPDEPDRPLLCLWRLHELTDGFEDAGDGLEVVAEWVTDSPTVEALTALGVNRVQGFGLHRPELALFQRE